MAEKAPDTTRWQGFTHKELYRLLHEGSGPAASADPSRRWAEIASTLTEVGQDLRHAIDRSGGVWSGRAAGTAYDSLGGLVNWAGQTAASATQMRQSVEHQADFLARARADMPVPEDMAPTAPDPTGVAAVQVITAGNDKEPVEAASASGAQKAFEVMTTYQRSTSTNTGGMAAFTAPAAVTGGPAGLIRHDHGGVVVSTPIVSVEVPLPVVEEHHDHHEDHQHHGWDETYQAGFTGGGDVIAPRGPGSFTVAAPRGDMFFGAALGLGLPLDLEGGATGSRAGGGRTSVPTGGMPTGGGSGVGSPTGGIGSTGGVGSGVPGPGGHPSSGPGSGSAAGTGPHSADLQSAAGQVAPAAGTPAAATPGAAAGSGTAGASAADRAPLRRLGVDSTIGSGQWFGDTPDYEIRGASQPRRRRDLTQQPITESVSVDGEEHQLPHNVIGEGPN